jgi:predicted nucleic acid-binding protein
MNKVLIDTNICLDAAIRRGPFAAAAIEILSRSESGEFTGFITAHSFDTIFYLLAKRYNRTDVYKALNGLRRTVRVSTVNAQVIDQALDLTWKDFEDAVQYVSAVQTGCQAIVTRNPDDFSYSKLPVFTPEKLLKQLSQ